MVKKRLITVMTINNGILFRTRNFIPDYRYTLNFVDAWSIDELIVLDITRPGHDSRMHFSDMIRAGSVFFQCPLKWLPLILIIFWKLSKKSNYGLSNEP